VGIDSIGKSPGRSLICSGDFDYLLLLFYMGIIANLSGKMVIVHSFKNSELCNIISYELNK